MPYNTQKFDREIEALKGLNKEALLDPLRQKQLKQEMLKSIAAVPQAAETKTAHAVRTQRLLYYFISVVLGLSLVGGTAFASEQALPGDVLYPVKRAKEKVVMALSVSEQSKATVQADQAQERLKELKEIKFRVQNPPAAPTVKKPEQQQQELEIQTETETKTQVSNALQNLSRVKAKQEAKGNTQAAAALDENIQRLKTKAQEINLKLDLNDNDEDSGSTNDGLKEQVKGARTDSSGNQGQHNQKSGQTPGNSDPNQVRTGNNIFSPSPGNTGNTQKSQSHKGNND